MLPNPFYCLAIKNDSSAILRSGNRFVMRAEEKLTAFLELQSAIRATLRRTQLLTKPLLATQFAPQRSQAEHSETEQRNCRAAIGHSSRFDHEREVLVR